MADPRTSHKGLDLQAIKWLQALRTANAARGYIGAVVFIVAATLVRLSLDPVLVDRSPFFTYYVAVLLSAWIGGTGPALLALVAGGLLADFLFIGTRYTLVIPGTADLVGTVAYVLVGLTAVALAESIRSQRDEIVEMTLDLDRQVQKRTSELSAERSFLGAVLEHAKDGIVACDANGNLKLFNKMTREFHGLPEEPLPPEEWASRYNLFEPDGTTPLAKEDIPLFRAMEEGLVVEAEIVIARNGRKPIPVVCSGSRIYNLAGETIGAVVVMHDITDRLALESRNEALQKAYRDAEGFNYSIAHDLRSPLRAVMSTSVILSEDYADNLPPEAAPLLERQIAASSRLGKLVDDLLKFSRLGLAEVKRETIDLSALATSIAQAQHGEGLTFDIDPNLSAEGDPSMIELLLQNLIENAVKFSEPGRPNRIEFGQTKDGLFYVRDQGIGFNPEYTHKLFKPFERLHHEEEYPGTGIGLANVKRVAERHGGEVRIESQGVGHGATVYFRLSSVPESDSSNR